MKNVSLVIFGPTGVGKTELSLRLALKYGGQIISVDSMQIYKGMDVGTAKPSKQELNFIPHHLIDELDPSQQFTAGIFKRRAEKILQKLTSENKLPILVGGTGLYFYALINGLIDIPHINEDLREKIQSKYKRFGQARMFAILKKIDPEYSQRIHHNDAQRTLRAIEVFFETKNKFSDYLKQKNNRIDFNYIIIGLTMDREKLYEKINLRVDNMIKNGLVEEVRELKEFGYTKDDPGIKAIGYRQMYDYLEGLYPLEEAIRIIKKESRHYAKRQITWFKKVKGINWLEPSQVDTAANFIAEKLEEYGIKYT